MDTNPVSFSLDPPPALPPARTPGPAPSKKRKADHDFSLLIPRLESASTALAASVAQLNLAPSAPAPSAPAPGSVAYIARSFYFLSSGGSGAPPLGQTDEYNVKRPAIRNQPGYIERMSAATTIEEDVARFERIKAETQQLREKLDALMSEPSTQDK